MTTQTTPRKANRLIHEKSPYLLQHAHNPVDWYPWGEEALAKAKREDKPILLSIGYSTCYWCHVMEAESFENPEIAKRMNETVVAIKVDREERPDLDAIYMTAVQAMSGQGGWPLNVFLTPEGKPFWGGTYFPPEDRGGRAGFPRVLQSIAEAWKTRREEVLRSSQELTQAIQASVKPSVGTPLTTKTLETAVEQYTQQYDSTYGGFGDAPKFPRSHSLSFLLRAWSRSRDAKILQMVDTTLDAMARGGLHDQLGGGFHRYSTDAQWLVPHFEKMLYDQALLARAYLEASQATGKGQYAEIAHRIFAYVLRDLRDPGGAFYSAEDAGEVGKEGEFYVWTPQEINAVLSADEAQWILPVYGVTSEGNFEGQTILHLTVPLEIFSIGRSDNASVGERRGTARLTEISRTLLEVRSRRPRPHRDDKILTDWNGLMIGALAYGARTLDEPRYAKVAEEAAAFVLDHMQHDSQLLHRYRDGEAAIPAYLDDYAFLSWGLLELYEATFDPRWLKESKRLAQEMLARFWDDQDGGFFFSGAHNEQLIAKTKELYDGAVPSGNSVAAFVLVRLAQLTMDHDFQRRAGQLFEVFSGHVSQAPHAFPQFLIALDAWLGPSQEIVIAGDPLAPATRQMIRAVRQHFLPRAVLALHPVGEAGREVEALIPFIKGQLPLKGEPTAYVCQHYVCQLPTTDLKQLITLLEGSR